MDSISFFNNLAEESRRGLSSFFNWCKEYAKECGDPNAVVHYKSLVRHIPGPQDEPSNTGNRQ